MSLSAHIQASVSSGDTAPRTLGRGTSTSDFVLRSDRKTNLAPVFLLANPRAVSQRSDDCWPVYLRGFVLLLLAVNMFLITCVLVKPTLARVVIAAADRPKPCWQYINSSSTTSVPTYVLTLNADGAASRFPCRRSSARRGAAPAGDA